MSCDDVLHGDYFLLILQNSITLNCSLLFASLLKQCQCAHCICTHTECETNLRWCSCAVGSEVMKGGQDGVSVLLSLAVSV